MPVFLQVLEEESSAKELVSCLAADIDRLGMETAEASATHADVSAALLEAQTRLAHLQVRCNLENACPVRQPQK